MTGFDLTTLTTNGYARRSLDKILLFNSHLKNNSHTRLDDQNKFPSLEFFDKLKNVDKSKCRALETAIILFRKECIEIVSRSQKLPAMEKQKLLDALFADVTYNNDLVLRNNILLLCIQSFFISLMFFGLYKALITNESNNLTPEVLLWLALSGSMVMAVVVLAASRDNTIIHENTDCFIAWANNVAKNLDEISVLDVSDVPEAITINSKCNYLFELIEGCRTNDRQLANRFVDNPEMRRGLDYILSFNKENNESATHENAADMFLTFLPGYQYRESDHPSIYHITMKPLLDASKIAVENSQLPHDQKNKLLDIILAFDGPGYLSRANLSRWIKRFSCELNKSYKNQSNQGYVLVPTAKFA